MTVFQPLRDTLAALPVHGMMHEVVGDVLAGKVAVLAAPTGSGKSMLLPGALADATDDQVVVLVPRRLLAVDAACNVAELSQTTLGKEVGFAIGQMNGETSLRSHDTKVLYCTYGYALRSGLINSARTLVLDEVHEGDEQISLARAVLHQRKQREPGLRILEMSATVNAPAQAAFWKGAADTTIHLAEGKDHKCKLIHEVPPLRGDEHPRSIEDVVLDLLEGKDGHDGQAIDAAGAEDFKQFMEKGDAHVRGPGRNGIALFRGGVKEVENSVATLKTQLQKRGINNVEVVGIHGGTPSDERRVARLPPKLGWRKIIVGTNVIESGVNLLWLDAGVSDGIRKVPYCRPDTGAQALVAESLTQPGVTQQRGRINRNPAMTGFDEGVFILFAKEGMESRRRENGPAIERESMLAPAFHAACLGYDPTTLKWDVGSAHALGFPKRLEVARQDLLRLELIHEDWSLTEDGQFINHLPVSPETGAMLCEAHRLDLARVRSGKKPHLMRDAVIIAALSEAKNLKRDTRENHGGDSNGGSDVLDAMTAYHRIVGQARRRQVFESVLAHSDEQYLASASEEQLAAHHSEREVLDELCARENMTLQGFIQVAQLVSEISQRLNKQSGIALPVPDSDDPYDAARYNDLKRCLMQGAVNQLFQFENGGLRDLLRDDGREKRLNGKPFTGYEMATSSMVNKRAPDGTLVIGELREVMPKRNPNAKNEVPAKGKKPNNDKENKEPLLVLGNATVIPPDVFIAWAKARAEREQYASNPTLMVKNGHASPDGKLHGNYAGKARFEIPVPSAARGDASVLTASDFDADATHANAQRKRGG